MRFLFVVDPVDTLKGYKDSSVAMMRSARARGHDCFVCEMSGLAAQGADVFARSRAIDTTPHDSAWYRLGGESEERLTAFSGVVMRKDPPFDLEYVTATWLLSAAERAGARVFNRPAAIRDQNEKLGILEFPQFVAPTLVASDAARIHAFIDEHRDVIVKRLDAMGGESVFRVRAHDPNRNVIVEVMTANGARSAMAQRYIPEIRDGDKRILLIDGRPVPFVLARLPMEGETRANLAAGGRGVARPLTAHDRVIAETLGPTLAARGLLVVGLDVIGDQLTEVNVTSPTCFREIADQTGFDAPGMFVDALEARCR